MVRKNGKAGVKSGDAVAPKILPTKMWALKDIKPYPGNPRTHPPAQITLLAQLMKRFGPDQDIVVDEVGEILKGHGRLSAAIEAELPQYPVTQRFGLTEEDKIALRISDNQVALLSGWNTELVHFELKKLQQANYPIELLGFDNVQLVSFLATPSSEDPEATPELPAKPISRLGDLLFSGDVAYCWHAGRHASEAQLSLEAAGFEIRCQLIWAKSSFAISRGHYNWQHEPCWYAVRKGKTAHWAGDKSASTLWEIAHNKNETGHSTQKPIECMRRPIQNNSKPGDYIYDPFLGSGTTTISAEMMNRYCLGVELDPAYVDVGVRRWQEFSKGEAILVGDGRTFAQIAKERQKPATKKAPGKRPGARREASRN